MCPDYISTALYPKYNKSIMPHPLYPNTGLLDLVSFPLILNIKICPVWPGTLCHNKQQYLCVCVCFLTLRLSYGCLRMCF